MQDFNLKAMIVTNRNTGETRIVNADGSTEWDYKAAGFESEADRAKSDAEHKPEPEPKHKPKK